jgi:hypothetical protein
MGIYVFYAVVAIVVALIWQHREKGTRDHARTLEIWLVSLVVVLVGVTGIAAFIAHAFFAEDLAKQIGFPAGNPFQFEVAVADLAFGVLGLLCAKYRGGFLAATVIGASVFLLGDAYGHIVQWLKHDNTEPGNVGGPLFADILVPAATLTLLALHARATKRPQTATPSDREADQAAPRSPGVTSPVS